MLAAHVQHLEEDALCCSALHQPHPFSIRLCPAWSTSYMSMHAMHVQVLWTLARYILMERHLVCGKDSVEASDVAHGIPEPVPRLCAGV